MDKSDKSIRAMKVFTVLVGIVVFITVFVVAFNMFDIKPVTIEDDEVDITKLAQKSMTASIMSINFDKQVVKLYDFNKGIAYSDDFNLSKQTKYLDKDSKLISKDTFKTGVIVDLSYTEESNIISKMMVSPKSWTKNEVTDFNFDYLKNEIEINNVDYILDKEYSLTYKDGKASYKDLAEGNVVISVSGYDKTVLGIDISYYLGRINLTYPDTLKGALVQVGDKKILKIEDLSDTYLMPGDYNLAITKQGIDDLVLSVKVEEDKVTNADVNDVKVKTGQVNININVSDYSLSVKNKDGNFNKTYSDKLDNVEGDYLGSNTLTLPYGIYSLTFTKDNYKAVTKTVEVTDKTKQINVTMLTEEEALLENNTTVEKYKINISTEPTDADIDIDGTSKATGKIVARLTPGTHTIKITRAGYEGVERTIEVTEDKEYKFILTSDNAFKSPTGEIVE